MVTMLWTSNSDSCSTSLKKDISYSKRPGYMKQSLIQPTMIMLCCEPQKQLTFYHLRNLFIHFFQLCNNYIRQGQQNMKMTMNLHSNYIFLGSQHKNTL